VAGRVPRDRGGGVKGLREEVDGKGGGIKGVKKKELNPLFRLVFETGETSEDDELGSRGEKSPRPKEKVKGEKKRSFFGETKEVAGGIAIQLSWASGGRKKGAQGRQVIKGGVFLGEGGKEAPLCNGKPKLGRKRGQKRKRAEGERLQEVRGHYQQGTAGKSQPWKKNKVTFAGLYKGKEPPRILAMEQTN